MNSSNKIKTTKSLKIFKRCLGFSLTLEALLKISVRLKLQLSPINVCDFNIYGNTFCSNVNLGCQIY